MGDRWTMMIGACVVASGLLAGCATDGVPAGEPNSGGASPARAIEWTTLSPGLRISNEHRLLEFDGTVPIDCHDPVTPVVYLELVACTPDTREHESLVVTEVPPSLIHAGLLALGLEPGEPAWIDPADPSRRRPPTGDAVRVTLHVGDGSGGDGSGVSEAGVSPVAWITDDGSGAGAPADEWVFAGSRLVEFRGETVYDADMAGTLIGLTTFGGETIAAARVVSPESAVDEPVWIADAGVVPARGTAVRVRIGPVERE